MQPTLRFQMSGRLIFGAGALAELPQAVRSLNATRPLLVTDPGVAKAGICQQVCDVLIAADIRSEVFDRVEPDPGVEVAEDCLRKARIFNPDLLIGLGGGSPLDIAKVAAIVLTNGGGALDYAGVDKVPRFGLPTIMLPTTAGTGSEVTPIAVLSDKTEHLKKGVVSDRLYPSVALVDPR